MICDNLMNCIAARLIWVPADLKILWTNKDQSMFFLPQFFVRLLQCSIFTEIHGQRNYKIKKKNE